MYFFEVDIVEIIVGMRLNVLWRINFCVGYDCIFGFWFYCCCINGIIVIGVVCILEIVVFVEFVIYFVCYIIDVEGVVYWCSIFCYIVGFLFGVVDYF